MIHCINSSSVCSIVLISFGFLNCCGIFSLTWVQLSFHKIVRTNDYYCKENWNTGFAISLTWGIYFNFNPYISDFKRTRPWSSTRTWSNTWPKLVCEQKAPPKAVWGIWSQNLHSYSVPWWCCCLTSRSTSSGTQNLVQLWAKKNSSEYKYKWKHKKITCTSVPLLRNHQNSFLVLEEIWHN